MSTQSSKPNDQPNPYAVRYLAARGVAIVAGVFILTVAAILMLDYYQMKTVDPLNTPALSTLRTELQQRPEDAELKEQIRALDLMARKAFFARQWQLRTGALMLLGGAIVFVAAIYVMSRSRPKRPSPSSCPGLDDPWNAAATARQWLGIIGGGVLLAALVLGFLSYRELHQERFATATSADGQPPPGVAGGAEKQTGSEDAAQAPESSASETAKVSVGFSEQTQANWPNFRGVGGIGKAPDADPPTDWDGKSGQGVLWKTKVPLSGNNSPVVWGKKIFLSGAAKETEAVLCFDADSGELLWQKSLGNVRGAPSEFPEVNPDTGYAAPTVATDGRRVVAIFATGNIAAFDFDGNKLWARHLGVPENIYGHSSSLLTYDGRVFVQFDHKGGAEIKALDITTGDTAWEQIRLVDISWASPILIEHNQEMQLITIANPLAVSYDPQTGEELWSTECMTGEVGPSPAYSDGRVYFATDMAHTVSLDVTDGSILWKSTDAPLPDAASLVATPNHLFLPTAFGVFSCLDATNGEMVWSYEEMSNGAYASPIIAGKHMYLVDLEGVMHIFKTAAEPEIIAEPELGEMCYTTPAFIGKRIYIRGSKHLFCIDGESALQNTTNPNKAK